MEQIKGKDNQDLALTIEDLAAGEVEGLVAHSEVTAGLEVWNLEMLVVCLVAHLVQWVAVLLDYLALGSLQLLKVVSLEVRLEVTMMTQLDSMVSELWSQPGVDSQPSCTDYTLSVCHCELLLSALQCC